MTLGLGGISVGSLLARSALYVEFSAISAAIFWIVLVLMLRAAIGPRSIVVGLGFRGAIPIWPGEFMDFLRFIYSSRAGDTNSSYERALISLIKIVHSSIIILLATLIVMFAIHYWWGAVSV